MAKFGELDAQVLGISVDSVPSLVAWAQSLGTIDYPLLSDFWPHGAVADRFGVLRSDGRSERALFIIDKQGVVRYVDIHDIDDQPDDQVLLDELRQIYPEAAARHPSESPQETASLPHGGIVMYCTRWCPECIRARRWLQKRNLSYTEVDVNAIPAAAKQVREWADGNLVTPTFDIDGTIIVDYDIDKLTEILG